MKNWSRPCFAPMVLHPSKPRWLVRGAPHSGVHSPWRRCRPQLSLAKSRLITAGGQPHRKRRTRSRSAKPHGRPICAFYGKTGGNLLGGCRSAQHFLGRFPWVWAPKAFPCQKSWITAGGQPFRKRRTPLRSADPCGRSSPVVLLAKSRLITAGGDTLGGHSTPSGAVLALERKCSEAGASFASLWRKAGGGRQWSKQK